MEVILTNIHHGDPAKGRGDYIYAELRDAKTHETIISATLDYILRAIEVRGYRLVAAEKHPKPSF